LTFQTVALSGNTHFNAEHKLTSEELMKKIVITLSIFISVLLSACDESSPADKLPKDAKEAVETVVLQTISFSPFRSSQPDKWKIVSVEQIDEAHLSLDDPSYGRMDEAWCVIIDPPVVNGSGTDSGHLIVVRTEDKWLGTLQEDHDFTRQTFEKYGCGNY
jgi:hypothetical protein